MNDDQSEGQSVSADSLVHLPVGGSAKAETALGTEIQAKIGQHLRAMYDDVVRQGVPDRFMDLLAQLDNKDPKAPEGGGQR